MRKLGLVAVVLLAAGCGTDEAAYANIQAVGEAAGCEKQRELEEPMLFSAESDDCTLASGDEVTINWFNSNEARDQYVDVGTKMGAVYVVGDMWVVECQDRAVQADVAASTKGEIPD